MCFWIGAFQITVIIFCTRFESLHCNCCGFIPQALEDFTKLTSSQLPQQLDGVTVNLPLVHCVVGQTMSLWGLHLQGQEESLFTEMTVCLYTA